MSKIVLLVTFGLAQVAAGVTVAGFNARAVDAGGTVLTGSIDLHAIGQWTQADGTGSVSTELVGDAVPGSFSGIVQAVDDAGNDIGAAVSFGGVVPTPAPAPAPPPAGPNMQPLPTPAPAPAPPPAGPNMQPLPTSVTVTVNV